MWSLGFSRPWLHVKFVVDKRTTNWFFFQFLLFFLANYHSTIIPYPSFTALPWHVIALTRQLIIHLNLLHILWLHYFHKSNYANPWDRLPEKLLILNCARKHQHLLSTTAKISQMFQPTPSSFKIDFNIFSHTCSSKYVTCWAVTHLPCPQTAGSPHVVCSWLNTTYTQFPFVAGGCPSHGDRGHT